MTLVHEIVPLDSMNNLGQWLKKTILGCEFRALDAMNNSGL